MLLSHKNDGTNLSSYHFIRALPAIELFVADLFTSILCHGYVPTVLRDCILVHIPKWFLTIQVILQPLADLQFGFKGQLSTTRCTGLIKNIVSKFVHAGSQVHMVVFLMQLKLFIE